MPLMGQQNFRFSVSINPGEVDAAIFFTDKVMGKNVEIEWDTTSNFNSGFKGHKVSSSNLDTIFNLLLNKQYSFRARTVGEAWSNTVYQLRSPLFPIFGTAYDGLKAINCVNFPLDEISHPGDFTYEFFLDTVITFNSSKLVYFNNQGNPSKKATLPFTKEGETYYLKSRLYTSYDTTGWRIEKLIVSFKPIINSFNYQCTPSAYQTKISFRYNTYGFDSTKTKLYAKNNSINDSTTNFYFDIVVPSTDNSDVQIVVIASLYKGNKTYEISDTTIIKDPLFPMMKEVSSDFYPLRFNIPCYSELEIYHYGDSNNTQLIQHTQLKDTFGSSLIFFSADSLAKCNYFKYRAKNTAGIFSNWYYYDFKLSSFNPAIVIYGTELENRNPEIDIQLLHEFKNGKVQFQLSDTINFQGNKLHTFVFNTGQNKYTIPALVENDNFVRARIFLNSDTSLWSNIATKRGVNGAQKGLKLRIDGATINYYLELGNDFIPLKGIELKLQNDNEAYTINPLKSGVYSTDSFLFQLTDTIKYRHRRYTAVDTSNWSEYNTTIFINSINSCLHPKITYNGYANTLDTFHIAWHNFEPNNKGYIILLRDFNNANIGQIPVDKDSISFVFIRNLYKAARDFALALDCENIRPNAGFGKLEYLPLGNTLSTIPMPKNSEAHLFYNWAQKELVNLSNSNSELKIYSISGSLQSVIDIPANSNVQLNNLKPGFYIAYDEDKNIKIKIVIQ